MIGIEEGPNGFYPETYSQKKIKSSIMARYKIRQHRERVDF